MSNITIENINIKIPGNKSISLTIEQAKDLQKLLNDTFGTEAIPMQVPIYVEPWPWKYRWWEPVWTCDTNTVTYTLNSHSGSS